MNNQRLQKTIKAANSQVKAVKRNIRSVIIQRLRKMELMMVEDTDEEGVDFRNINGLDFSFSPDNAIDEDEYIVAITISDGGKPMLWSYDSDSGEVDDIRLNDDRLTMEDLMEVVKLIDKLSE